MHIGLHENFQLECDTFLNVFIGTYFSELVLNYTGSYYSFCVNPFVLTFFSKSDCHLHGSSTFYDD